jgi:Dolichyl-phosphate-mannose-protein mannosyltransferase
MLGKYYSVYLIAGFIAAALQHPRRSDYLRSPAPWLSILAGFVVLAPHLAWLVMTGPAPFRYALAGHIPSSAADELVKTLLYAAGGLAYVALPVAAYLLALRPDRRLLAATLWPDDPGRRMLVVLLAVPLILPMLTAPIVGVILTPLWTMSGWFLLPIILLSPAELTVRRAATMRVALAVAIVTAVVLAAAPVVAWHNFTAEAENGRVCCRSASDELTRVWHEATGRPLTLVSGDSSLAQGTTFYSADHPDSAPAFEWETPPWVTDSRRAGEGFAVICFANDRACDAAAEQNAAGRSGVVVRIEKDVTASFFGMASASAKIALTMVPPQR